MNRLGALLAVVFLSAAPFAVLAQHEKRVRRIGLLLQIVMASVGDPVALGLVSSLARPRGNVTGMMNIAIDTSPKMLELARMILPQLKRVASLRNSKNPALQVAERLLASEAQRYGVTVVSTAASEPQLIELVFATASREKAQALLVHHDPFLISQSAQIGELALSHKLPVLAQAREHVLAGALKSYGVDLRDQWRRAAAFVAKILDGAKPAELPVEQATRIELVLNKKTAAALGIRVVSEIMVRADEVIE